MLKETYEKVEKTISRFFWNIKNITEWIPILYNNFDWDYSFLYDILSFKLKRMSKYFKKTDILYEEDAKNIYTNIDRCIELINKLQDDNYEEEAFVPYREKYGCDEGFETRRFIDEKGRRVTEIINVMSEEQKEEYSASLQKSQELHDEYQEELYKILKEKIEFWWD